MWDELGIAPSDDPKAIRRAYAARLKTLDPDRDPGAFARLRMALEWALGHTREGRGTAPRRRQFEPPNDTRRMAALSRHMPEREETVAPGFNRPIVADDRTAPLTAEDDIRERAILGALDAALRRRDTAGAITLYNRAAATGALSLDAAPEMLRRLFGVAVDDASFDGPAFRDLTTSLGWDRLDGQAAAEPALARKVRERLAAEDWYDGLVASAAKPGVANHYVARLLLGRCGRFFMDAQSAKIREIVTAYRTHQRYLGRRIEPAWVARLERRLRRREIAWLTLMCGVLAWALTGVGGEVLRLLAAHFRQLPLSIWAVGALVIVLLVLHLGSRLVRLFRLVLPPRIRLALRRGRRAIAQQSRRLVARLKRK